MDQLVRAQDGGPGDPPVATRTLGLSEVTSRPTTVKCMGRTYGAVAADGSVVISDVTDITRSVVLGTARPDATGVWDVRTPRGARLAGARDLLHAVAVLREAGWPPRDPR